MAKIKSNDSDEEILSRIDKRVTDWFSYFKENNLNYENDTKFVYDEDGQWTDEEINEYKQEGKPRLTFNMLSRFILNLQGEFSLNTPDLQVSAIDNTTADQDQVDLLTDAVRTISFDSRNDIVYQTAFACALTGGYGAFRIGVVPEAVYSFNQTVKYYAIQDPTTCFWDQSSEDPDKGDGDFCGICHKMSKKEFESKYPNIETPESYSVADMYSRSFSWLTQDDIVIVEYYEKQYFKRKIAQLSDGRVLDYDEAENVIKKASNIAAKAKKFLGASKDDLVPEIVSEKIVDDYKIILYRAVKGKLIEDPVEWDSKKLPIIFQPGCSRWVDGKEKTISFIHWIKDAQRSYNYSRSEYLYRLKLSRYEPYLASVENIQGYEKEWKQAHRARSVLPYKVDSRGNIPQRQSAQEVPQSLLAEMNQSLSDIQNIPGRYEANLGAQGNEVSGVAIQSRQAPGNMNAFQFFENARLAIESGARVTTQLLQRIFDTQRTVVLTKKNGNSVSTIINKDSTNEIPKGEMNVYVTVGASFEQQQKAAIDQLLSLVSALPAIASVIPDLVVENLNIKNAPQLVSRIKEYVLNPLMVAQESGDPQKIQAAQAQANQQQQLQQATEQLQILLQKTAAQDDQIRALASQTTAQANMMNAQTNRLEALSKGAIESQRADAEIKKANVELQTEALKTIGEAQKIRQNQIL